MQSHQIDANASGGQDDENAGNGVQVEEQEQKEEEQAPLVQLQERMRKVASCVRKIPSYKTVRAQQELLSAIRLAEHWCARAELATATKNAGSDSNFAGSSSSSVVGVVAADNDSSSVLSSSRRKTWSSTP